MQRHSQKSLNGESPNSSCRYWRRYDASPRPALLFYCARGKEIQCRMRQRNTVFDFSPSPRTNYSSCWNMIDYARFTRVNSLYAMNDQVMVCLGTPSLQKIKGERKRKVENFVVCLKHPELGTHVIQDNPRLCSSHSFQTVYENNLAWRLRAI